MRSPKQEERLRLIMFGNHIQYTLLKEAVLVATCARPSVETVATATGQ